MGLPVGRGAEDSEDHTAVRVRTVCGEIASSDLGLSLVHEHIVTDVRQVRAASGLITNWEGPSGERAFGPVLAEEASSLRHDPYSVLENCQLDELGVAVSELGAAIAQGVRTVVEPTPEGIGRFPEALRAVSMRTGLQVIMGCGFYVEGAHPAGLARLSVDDIARHIVDDVQRGVGPDHVRAGVIGEIGVESFGEGERRVLAAATRAYCEVGVPLYVHLPAWERIGHAVLDAVESEGGVLGGVVLCHMSPSGPDEAYQDELFARGAWLGYDMLGMEGFSYGEGLDCPSEEQDARAVLSVLARGRGGQLLLGSDVFLKCMLKRYGGNGYDYVVGPFSSRLVDLGATKESVEELLVGNPERLFVQAALSKGGV